jgi:hypothetical protein
MYKMIDRDLKFIGGANKKTNYLEMSGVIK